MNRLASNDLSELLTLAHDKSDEGRMALVERIADIFFSETVSLSLREEVLVNDLIDELLKTEYGKARQQLIKRFTDNIEMSRGAAVRIANAPFEIAEDVLKNNAKLQDEDLITIVTSKSKDHAKAIAQRLEINEVVADALVATGDLQIMKIVAENLGAKLSTRAFDILIESARLAAMLQKPILERKELSHEAAVRLYWWTSHDLRRSTLERFGFGPNRLEEELNKTIEEMLDVHILRKDDFNSMNDLADWLANRDALKPAILSQLLRTNHYTLFNIVFARIANLTPSVIEHITHDKSGRMMSALCRAIKLEKGKFISLYLLARSSNSEDIINPKELAGVLGVFERLTDSDAEAMLATWRADPSSVTRFNAKSA